MSLDAANSRLKLQRLKIEARGGKLSLRGTLPPKPGSGRVGPHQQRISLGWAATDSNVERAEREAILIRAKVDSGVFDWQEYLDVGPTNPMVAANVLKRFEAHYRERHQIKDATWATGWWKVFKHLPPNELLTAEALVSLARTREPHSAIRKQFCQKLQRLADFAGIDANLSGLSGEYGLSKIKPIELPTDEQIEAAYNQITHPGWRWVYGVIAAGGLRPSEAFFCDCDGKAVYVHQGKTGPRTVNTLLWPEWGDQWQLGSRTLPNVDANRAYSRNRLGTRVGNAFARYQIPFSPYALRHAWAIRASVKFGFAPTVSATMMGHSPEVHLKTYNRWITGDQVAESVESVLSAADRPTRR